jgi:hypothetical protein
MRYDIYTHTRPHEGVVYVRIMWRRSLLLQNVASKKNRGFFAHFQVFLWESVINVANFANWTEGYCFCVVLSIITEKSDLKIIL